VYVPQLAQRAQCGGLLIGGYRQIRVTVCAGLDCSHAHVDIGMVDG
jgi:hypothetical protein